MTKKIIILASERSGTNLFRTLLNNHKDICGPVSPHFFDAFKPNLEKYGDLNIKDNSTLLLSHMSRLANHVYHDWNLATTPEYLVDKYDVKSIETAFDAMYSFKAVEENKVNYVSKDNHLFNYTDILNNLEGIKYVYLYRDPRDHVASWLKTPLFMHTSFDIIQKWKKEQNLVFQIAQNNNVYFMSYENLIKDTSRTMTKFLNYMDLDIDENCFNTDKNNKESKRNIFWKNLSKPILTTNSEKYKKNLNKRDILIIESLAKSEIERLGYGFETNADWRPYKGFGYELIIKRKISKHRYKRLFYDTMAELQDKLKLIETLKSELK